MFEILLGRRNFRLYFKKYGFTKRFKLRDVSLKSISINKIIMQSKKNLSVILP